MSHTVVGQEWVLTVKYSESMRIDHEGRGAVLLSLLVIVVREECSDDNLWVRFFYGRGS